MKRKTIFVGLFLALAAAVAYPQTETKDGLSRFGPPEIYPPSAEPFGSTQARWQERLWDWSLRIPASKNPHTDPTGAFCQEDQSGRVMFLSSMFIIPGGTTVRNCSVDSDVALLLPVLGTFCSPATDGTTTQAESRACARNYGDNFVNTSVKIDGHLIDWSRHRFTSNGTFSMNLPNGNIFEDFGFPAGGFEIENAVADGYNLMLKPLAVGLHVIHVHGENKLYPGYSWDLTLRLSVVRSSRKE